MLLHGAFKIDLVKGQRIVVVVNRATSKNINIKVKKNTQKQNIENSKLEQKQNIKNSKLEQKQNIKNSKFEQKLENNEFNQTELVIEKNKDGVFCIVNLTVFEDAYRSNKSYFDAILKSFDCK